MIDDEEELPPSPHRIDATSAAVERLLTLHDMTARDNPATTGAPTCVTPNCSPATNATSSCSPD